VAIIGVEVASPCVDHFLDYYALEDREVDRDKSFSDMGLTYGKRQYERWNPLEGGNRAEVGQK